jgi:hypothetical protein
MKKPTPNEINSKTCAFMIIISLILMILMQGVYYYQNMVPYSVFITILFVCAIISSISFVVFLYYKIVLGEKKPAPAQIRNDILKILFLAVMVYFTVATPINIVLKG